MTPDAPDWYKLVKELEIDGAPYNPSLALQADDFRALLASVEPVDAHLGVYSHRLFELLVRACTDLESICKDCLRQLGYETWDKQGKLLDDSSWTMRDYVHLSAALGLPTARVHVEIWRPKMVTIAPFAGWVVGASLPWYQAYNDVKHNRRERFGRASLENVRSAIAGVATLLYRVAFMYDSPMPPTFVVAFD